MVGDVGIGDGLADDDAIAEREPFGRSDGDLVGAGDRIDGEGELAAKAWGAADGEVGSEVHAVGAGKVEARAAVWCAAEHNAAATHEEPVIDAVISRSEVDDPAGCRRGRVDSGLDGRRAVGGRVGEA